MPLPVARDSEWSTRKTLIDTALRAAGWRITPFVQGKSLADWNACAVEEYQTATGPADYALIVGGQVLGIVEAKKLSVGPQNVLVQAGRYAKAIVQDGLSFGAYGVPFLYGTNGEIVWFHDARHDLNVSRELAAFHTPEALVELSGRDLDASLARLSALPNDSPWLRPYQRDANAAIEDAIARRKNAMLVAMATGTGKTFVMVNEVYRLMKAGVAKRVLFLVDRRALATDGEHATPQRSTSGVYLLSARNVLDGRLSFEKVDYVPEQVYQKLSERLTINPGDVLLSCSGSVGRSCTAPDGVRFALVRSVAVLKPMFGMGPFLSLALRSQLLQGQIREKKTETAQANIFQGKIRTLVFPLPPLAEQQEIVRRFEALAALADRLETRYEKAKAQVDRLTQSVIAKAFRGDLVPTEAALAKAEGRSYEPASELPENIKRSQQNSTTRPPGRRHDKRRK